MLYELLGILAADDRILHERKDQLSSLKLSTRDELMKRMLRATDFLHSTPDARPNLDELARISCLSKFHFLRLFKLAFRQTPHQYLNTIRIQRSMDLLAHTDLAVNSIGDSLGFERSSTFSRTFHRLVGVYPSQYRAQL